MTIEDRNNLPRLLQETDAILARVAEKVGQYLEGRILDMIDTQWPGWPALAASTVQRKGSSKAWVSTGGLRDEITHHIKNYGLEKTVEVGIFESENGVIAYCLECGTSRHLAVYAGGEMHQGKKGHIPERPLFRLVVDLETAKIEEMIKKELGREIDRHLF